MQTIIVPDKLKKMLCQVMLNNKSNSILSKVNADFSVRGISITDISEGHMCVIAKYLPSYFEDFKATEKDVETVVLQESLLEKLGWGFKSEKVHFDTKGNKIVIEGLKDTCTEDLSTPMEAPNIDNYDIITNDKGMYPADMNEAPLIICMKKDDLTSLPKMDSYNLKSTGADDDISISFDKNGTYKTKILPERVERNSVLDIKIDGMYLLKIAQNVSDKFWLFANDQAIVIVNKSDEMMLTYILSNVPKEEGA